MAICSELTFSEPASYVEDRAATAPEPRKGLSRVFETPILSESGSLLNERVSRTDVTSMRGHTHRVRGPRSR
jgi:hypothetical protein